MRSLLRLLPLATLLLVGCSRPLEKATTVSCYIADQHRCEEAPAPTKAQDEARAVECSSAKCTIVENGTTVIRRTYQGAETAYQKSFCVETAKGAWSTTF